jgi:serine/threonine-protein kinase
MTEVATAEQSAQAIAPEKIRASVQRVLASATFLQVDRLKRFLGFIVEEALQGRGGNLKEYVIGVQVFDKESGFDPRTDPIVRVQARRLRARLTRYFQEEGQADEIFIDLPRGRYTPVFRLQEAPAPKRSIPAALFNRNTLEIGIFADHTAGSNLAWFCHGLREELVLRLSATDGLRVLAPNPGVPHAEPPGLIVGGSVRGTPEKARVTAHLVDGAGGAYLWSEALDVTLADPLVAQDTIARLVQRRIESEIGGPGKSQRSRRRADNLAARNLCLQGRYHLDQRTEDGLRKAVEFFEKTLVEDANYALAHSGLADAYGLLSHYGVLAPAEVWTKAASSAATGVMLDSGCGEAHTSLAHVKSTQDWDWEGAEREFRQAIRLAPRYPTAHHWFAVSCLAPLGRLDEALEEILVAQSLDPVSSIIGRDLAMVHCYRRDFDLALEQCDHTIALNPHFSPAWWALGFVQEQREDFDEATAAFERAIRLAPESPRMQAALARSNALSGRRRPAQKSLHELEAMATRRYVAPFEFALLHFALQDPEAAFRWLEQACRDRSFDVLSLNVDPRFDPWKHDKRFAAAIHQMGV